MPDSALTIFDLSDPLKSADLFRQQWKSALRDAERGDASAKEYLVSLRNFRARISSSARRGNKQAIAFMYRLGGKTPANPDDVDPQAYAAWLIANPSMMGRALVGEEELELARQGGASEKSALRRRLAGMGADDELKTLMTQALPHHDSRTPEQIQKSRDYKQRWNALAVLYRTAHKDPKSNEYKIIRSIVISANQGNKQSLEDINTLNRIKYHTNYGKGTWDGVVPTE